MPAHRVTMRKTREILRLRWGEKLRLREVAQSCNCSPSTVHRTVERAAAAGLSWPLPEELDDAALDERLFPSPVKTGEYPEPDLKHIHVELGRKGVTLVLLWQEYRSQHPDGCSYSTLCDRYRDFKGGLNASMRQAHVPGEKLYVDYCGDKATLHDALTGEETQVSLFVAAMGASQKIYARAVAGEDSHSWLSAHQAAFLFFGGVPKVVVPDNLKSAVTKPNYYDPELNRAYKDLADHYDVVILPARVRRPKDKAKVENAVLQVERWVLAPLRNHKFFSMGELNEAIAERLEELNNKRLSKMDCSRQELFERIDKPELRELPSESFRVPEWKLSVGVNIDYHVEFGGHYYSVPCSLIRKRVEIRATGATVECFYRGKRVACHVRSHQRGGFTTLAEHRPKTHRHYAEWTPSRLIRWASTVGPETGRAVESVMASKRHPEEGYRAALGVIRLASRYGKPRLESACHRALALHSATYKTIHSILKTGMDSQPLNEPTATSAVLTDHENLRGSRYYH